MESGPTLVQAGSSSRQRTHGLGSPTTWAATWARRNEPAEMNHFLGGSCSRFVCAHGPCTSFEFPRATTRVDLCYLAHPTATHASQTDVLHTLGNGLLLATAGTALGHGSRAKRSTPSSTVCSGSRCYPYTTFA
jgi:hypothetical protein